MKITVIDVGHGSATLFRSPSEVVLVDTGAGIAIVEFLLRAGISRVDCVVISHADRDHVGGLIAMISTGTITIGRVILNSDGDKSTASWKNLAYELDDLNRDGQVIVVPVLREGDTVPTATPGLVIQALAPRQRLVQLGVGNTDKNGHRITSNSMSAVLLAKYYDRPVVLITGDMDAVGWDHLSELDTELAADVLVAPHHGGLAGSKLKTVQMTSQLCQRVNPIHIFVSNGRGSHGTPRKEVIAAARIAAPRARVACTQVSERCLVATLPRPAMLARDAYSSGATKDACCAGSIDLTLSAAGPPNVDLTDHEVFVTQLGSTALCRA